MSHFVGGIRTRMIRENFQNMIHDSLDALHWFDANRQHDPLQVLSGDQILENERDQIPIKPNIVAVQLGDAIDTEAELGSVLTNKDAIYFIDVYAENEAVGLHLGGDIVDILLGKFNSIGRDGPELQVMDLTQDPPVEAFWCEIEDVSMDRVQVYRREYERFYWMISCRVLDSYYGDEGPD